MFKKTLIALAATCVVGIAQAGTLTPLQVPPVVNLSYPYFHAWAGTGFAADDTIVGFSQSSHASPCSGRGCVPVNYVQVYASTWSTAGVSLTAVHCGQLRIHRPQLPQWTYDPGYDATNCKIPTLGTDTTVTVDGVSYYYVATSADGLYELINGQFANFGSNVYQF